MIPILKLYLIEKQQRNPETHRWCRWKPYSAGVLANEYLVFWTRKEAECKVAELVYTAHLGGRDERYRYTIWQKSEIL